MSPASDTSLPPGPKLPRAAQTLAWITRPLPFMERCRQQHGDIFTLRIQNEGNWVFLCDPEEVKRTFTGDPNLLRAGEANFILGPIVGSRSVLLLDEPEHMSHRKLMLPPLHGERMHSYGELMSEVSLQEVERWPIGEPFALWPRMQAITLEIIMRAVFGITDGEHLARLRGLLRSMLDWTTNRRQLATMAVLGPQRIERRQAFRALMDPIDRTVLETIRERRQAPDLESRQDILSMMLQARFEDGRPMSDTELRDELITLLVAGHETTATSLAWALERLLRHPQKLSRLREEALEGIDTYTEAVVKETLRLRPVLPIVLRRLAAPMQFAGYELPAGVTVAPCIYLMHRREDIYPEPNRFLPERFLEQTPGTYTWIPFGGGVRRCLGASFAQFEMAKVLQSVLCAVDLEATEERSERVVRRAITFTPDRQAQALVSRRRSFAPSTGHARPLAATLG
jgi:cytochrome P450